MGFEEDMTEYEEVWDAAPESSSGQLLPDGLHQVSIKISRVEKKDWGWEFALMFANAEGTAWSNINLDNDKGVEIAKQVAAFLGFHGPITGLKEYCETGAFLDLVCDVQVKTKAGETRDFTNVYIKRVYDTSDSQDAAPAAGDDSDIPF